MNRNPDFFETSPTLELGDEPLPLRLPAGAAVFAARGTVWITQERLLDDVILAPGERFDVKSGELILVSAVHGDAAIHWVAPDTARSRGERELQAFVVAHARELRSEEVARVYRAVRDGISTLAARLRGPAVVPARAASH